MSFSGAWGKIIHEKKPETKISGHCAFQNDYQMSDDSSLAPRNELNWVPELRCRETQLFKKKLN
jgi:hypothetical protein